MNMIEKVARVICQQHDFHHWDDIPEGPSKDGSICRFFYRLTAKAAIEAMMEPSEGMVAHGEAVTDFMLPECMDNTNEGRQAEMRMAFQTMIRTALEEE